MSKMDAKVKEAFGQELKKLRREGSIKYTQKELADLAGVSSVYISLLETGKATPTSSIIHKLSPHLAIKPNDLLKIIGMVEMDLARTYTDNRNKVKDQQPNLSPDQIEEFANYLTYLDFKASVLK
ncbi:MAG: helix-turn-helix domain-containing protein [Dehalococcoidia bacterium]